MRGARTPRIVVAAALVVGLALVPALACAAPTSSHAGSRTSGLNNHPALSLQGLASQLRDIATNLWALAGASIEVNGVHGDAGASIEVNGVHSDAGASIEVNGVHSDAGASIEVNG